VGGWPGSQSWGPVRINERLDGGAAQVAAYLAERGETRKRATVRATVQASAAAIRGSATQPGGRTRPGRPWWPTRCPASPASQLKTSSDRHLDRQRTHGPQACSRSAGPEPPLEKPRNAQNDSFRIASGAKTLPTGGNSADPSNAHKGAESRPRRGLAGAGLGADPRDLDE